MYTLRKNLGIDPVTATLIVSLITTGIQMGLSAYQASKQAKEQAQLARQLQEQEIADIAAGLSSKTAIPFSNWYIIVNMTFNFSLDIPDGPPKVYNPTKYINLCPKEFFQIGCGSSLIKPNFNVIGTRYWYNNDPNIDIFIPNEPIFSLIKNNVIEGTGLKESYKQAGEMLYMFGYDNCHLESFAGYPSGTLDMPIKMFIYDAVDYVNGKPIGRPYADGVWIHEQASTILSMYFLGALSKWGRLELEPGLILPTQSEGTCIKNAIRYSNKPIEQAFKDCMCYEIFPVQYSKSIEILVKNTNWTLFYCYMISVILSQRPDIPIIPGDDKKLPGNNSQYLPLALLALLFIGGQ